MCRSASPRSVSAAARGRRSSWSGASREPGRGARDRRRPEGSGMDTQPAGAVETGEKTLSMEGPGVVLETRRDGLAFLIFDRPHDKVNLLSAPLVAVLEILVDQAAHDKNVRALVVVSAKPGSFIAGADVNEIRALGSIQDAEAASRKGHRLFDAIEGLPFPVVAAINSTY